MGFVEAVTALIGIVGSLSPHFNQITNPGQLCAGYAQLKISNASVIDGPIASRLANGSAVTYQGSDIPQYCNTTTVALQEMIPMMFMYQRLLEPFHQLPGFDAEMKAFITALKPVSNMAISSPNLVATVMTPQILMAVAQLESGGHDGKLEQTSMLMIGIATKVVAHCSKQPIPATSTDQQLIGLFGNSDIPTFCQSHNITDIADVIKSMVQQWSGSNGQEMTELRAAIPLINLYVQILSKVVAYPNVPPQVKQVVDGLKPLAGKDANDPLLLAALTDPNVLMASRMIANETFQMMVVGVLPGVDSLLKYCMSTDPNKDIDTQFPMIRALQPVGNPSCIGINANLKQQLYALTDVYTKEVKSNVEMQALMKQIPIIMTTLKILQPFLDIPSMDAALVRMARGLMPLMQMDPTDPMFLLMFASPDAGAMIQQLKAMEQPDMMQKLEVMVAGVAFLPYVCSTAEMRDGTKETLKLTQGEDIGALCKKMDMSTVGANIKVLEQLNAAFTPIGNPITDIIGRIPLLQKTIEVIEPFMTLPGFDAELKGIAATLAPLAKIDSTKQENTVTLYNLIADASIRPVLEKLQTQAMEDKIAAMMEGIGGLTYACNQSKPEYFNHLRTFLDGSTVDTMCAKAPASLAGDLGKLQVYEDALKPTKQPATTQDPADSSAGVVQSACVVLSTLLALFVVIAVQV